MTRRTRSGFGDIAVRWKVNLWGNDGGKTASGVISFAKFPTNQNGLGNDAVQGGIVFPLEIKLAKDWDLGLDFDITYRVTPYLQLDAGINLGVTESAADVNPVVGLTVRY